MVIPATGICHFDKPRHPQETAPVMSTQGAIWTKDQAVVNSSYYAVVVGISRSPHYKDLASPAKDAQAMRDWLTDPGGGGLPADNVWAITSDSFGDASEEGGRPNLADVNNKAFRQVVNRLKDGHTGRRL